MIYQPSETDTTSPNIQFNIISVGVTNVTTPQTENRATAILLLLENM